jgi:hypothetical protein
MLGECTAKKKYYEKFVACSRSIEVFRFFFCEKSSMLQRRTSPFSNIFWRIRQFCYATNAENFQRKKKIHVCYVLESNCSAEKKIESLVINNVFSTRGTKKQFSCQFGNFFFSSLCFFFFRTPWYSLLLHPLGPHPHHPDMSRRHWKTQSRETHKRDGTAKTRSIQ